MFVKSLAAALVFATVPLMAMVPASALPLPNQILGGGDNTIVQGRAQVSANPLGTFILIHRPAASVMVAGLIPWGDQGGFPDLGQLDGREVQIYGVVALYGMPRIIVTDPNQVAVMD